MNYQAIVNTLESSGNSCSELDLFCNHIREIKDAVLNRSQLMLLALRFKDERLRSRVISHLSKFCSNINLELMLKLVPTCYIRIDMITCLLKQKEYNINYVIDLYTYFPHDTTEFTDLLLKHTTGKLLDENLHELGKVMDRWNMDKLIVRNIHI